MIKFYALYIVLVSAFLSSCSSQKAVQKNISTSTDSTFRSDKHRTFTLADSVVQQLNFSFDTLEITIERPRLDTVAIASEIVKLRAVKGKFTNDRQHQRNIIETQSQLDTVAYHQATADKSMEHTATTRIYEPPSGTIIILVSLLLVATFVFIRFRK